MCSLNLSLSDLSLSPIYCLEHKLHSMQYIILLVLHVTFWCNSTLQSVAVALTTLPDFIKGQILQLLQGTIPGVNLFGLAGGGFGTFYLINFSLMFFCFL